MSDPIQIAIPYGLFHAKSIIFSLGVKEFCEIKIWRSPFKIIVASSDRFSGFKFLKKVRNGKRAMQILQTNFYFQNYQSYQVVLFFIFIERDFELNFLLR